MADIPTLVHAVDAGALAESTVRAALAQNELLSRERIADMSAQQNQQRINYEQAESASRIQAQGLQNEQTRLLIKRTALQTEQLNKEVPVLEAERRVRMNQAKIEETIGKARLGVLDANNAEKLAKLNIQNEQAAALTKSKELDKSSRIMDIQYNLSTAMNDQTNPIYQYRDRVNKLSKLIDSNQSGAALMEYLNLEKEIPIMKPEVEKLRAMAGQLDAMTMGSPGATSAAASFDKFIQLPSDISAGKLGGLRMVMDEKGRAMPDPTSMRAMGDVVQGLRENRFQTKRDIMNAYFSMRDPEEQKKLKQAAEAITGKPFKFDQPSHLQEYHSVVSEKAMNEKLPFNWTNRFALPVEKIPFVGLPIAMTSSIVARYGLDPVESKENAQFNLDMRALEGLTIGKGLVAAEGLVNTATAEIYKINQAWKDKVNMSDEDSTRLALLTEHRERAVKAVEYLTRFNAGTHAIKFVGLDHQLTTKAMTDFPAVQSAEEFVGLKAAKYAAAATPPNQPVPDWRENDGWIQQAKNDAIVNGYIKRRPDHLLYPDYQ